MVGVGAQSDSCRVCDPCSQHKEPYCVEGIVGTYDGVYKRGAGKGDKTYGGVSQLLAPLPGVFIYVPVRQLLSRSRPLRRQGES